jgi:hypothetical protein
MFHPDRREAQGALRPVDGPAHYLPAVMASIPPNRHVLEMFQRISRARCRQSASRRRYRKVSKGRSSEGSAARDVSHDRPKMLRCPAARIADNHGSWRHFRVRSCGHSLSMPKHFHVVLFRDALRFAYCPLRLTAAELSGNHPSARTLVAQKGHMNFFVTHRGTYLPPMHCGVGQHHHRARSRVRAGASRMWFHSF